MDRLNALISIINGKIENQQLSNANFSHLSNRKITVKNYENLKLRIDEYGDIYAIGISIETDFAFSINNPDRVMIFNKPLDVAGFPYKVYISSNGGNPFLSATFRNFWKVFSEKIRNITFEGLGLQIWVWRSKIVTVSCTSYDL